MPRQSSFQFVAPVVKAPLIVLGKRAPDRVSGAGPHGGWALPAEVTAASRASADSFAAFGPHGGW